MKPLIVLTAIATAGALIKGIMSLSFFWILVGMIHCYFFIVLYSLYEVLEFEGEQKECHQSAVSGYSQCNEPEIYANMEKGNICYQSEQPQGP
jgi:hypothetical protein